MRRLAAATVVLLPCAVFWLVGQPMIGRGLLALGHPGAAAAFFDDPEQKGAAFYFARRWSEAAAAFGTNAANAYNRGNALARAERFAEAVAAYDQRLAADPDDEDAAFNRALVASLIARKAAPADANAISANSAASRARDTHDESHADGETGGSGDGFAGGQEGASKPGAQGGSKAGKLGRGEQSSFESGQGQAKGSAGDSDGAGRTGGLQVDVAKAIRDLDRRVRRRLEARSVQPTIEWLSTLADDPGRFLKLRILAEKARRKARPAVAEEESDP
jgi:Ca-activated chloride channel family protein